MKSPIKEEDETPADESKETPAMQAKEVASGEEMHMSDFQTEASALMESCSSQEDLDFLQGLIDEKKKEYSSDESVETEEKVPADFSSESMPE